MAKKVKQEKTDPITVQQAQEIVAKVKRAILKKESTTRVITQVTTMLKNIKADK